MQRQCGTAEIALAGDADHVAQLRQLHPAIINDEYRHVESCGGRPSAVSDSEVMNSEPRIWLITGATSGFGRAIAQAALDAGDTVIASGSTPDALGALVTAHPDRVTPVELDVTDSRRITAVVADVILWHGRIDVLVNNAGRGLVGAVEETTEDELRGLMELHFFGPAALTTRRPAAHAPGAIGAMTCKCPAWADDSRFPGVGGYSATKFALEGLTEALAAEVRSSASPR